MDKGTRDEYIKVTKELSKYEGVRRVHIDGSPYEMDEKLFNKLVRKGKLKHIEPDQVPGYWNKYTEKVQKENDTLKGLIRDLAVENGQLKKFIKRFLQDR